MNSNDSQLDLDFISIIKSEEFLNSLQKLNNSLVCQQNSNHLKTINESIDGLNENLKQYYDSFVLNSEEWFVCKYDDCDHSERSEADILRHLSHHLAQERDDEIEVKPNISNIVFNDNNEPLLPNNLVIDENLFEVKPKVKSDESVRKDCALEDLADLDMHIEKRVVDSKDKYFCRWTDCQFEANQKSVISKHVLNKHLAPKQPNPFDGVDSETKYWESIMKSSKQWLQKPNSNAKSAQSLPGLLPSLPAMPSLTTPQGLTPFIEPSLQPLMGQLLDEKQWLERITSMATLQVFGSQLGVDKGLDKNGFDVTLDEKEKLKNHLNISNKEENILLSCKGLAAMSKVRQYYESQVIDGQKVFFCRWRQNGSVCTFQTRKSQKIAQHINLSHIGVEFKCPKPFCNKVFKNPNTYREHQKNHICGFGIFGYGSKGVIGACRNENLNRYRDRVVIEGKKFYRCIFLVNGAQCGAITRYHMAMKRHIHSHTCPHRKNLKLKQNQEIIHKMKSDNWNLDLGLGAGASTSSASISPLSSPNSNPSMSELKSNSSCAASSSSSSKKTYQCRRTNCTATFSNTADLLKHENLLCKFVKNGLTQNLFNNKSVGKHMPTISAEELAAAATTKQSVLQQNGYKLGNTSHANSASLRAAETVNRYLSTKTMNGVDYHLCVYPKCKFTSKVMIKTIEHIHSQHMANDSQLHIESNLSTNSAKRVRTSTESPETDSSKENSSKKSKSVELVSNVSPSQVLEPMLAAIGGQLDQVAYQMNQLTAHQLNPHLIDQITHNYFVCDLENCTKQFRSEAALNQHKINHICGFGIKGRKAVGVCDLDNVRSYRDQMVVDDKTVYLCKLCRKVSENKSSALICIHSHICPARLSIVDPQDSAFTESVVQRIIETNRKKSSPQLVPSKAPNGPIGPNGSAQSAVQMVDV